MTTISLLILPSAGYSFPVTMARTKECFKCLRALPMSEFYDHPAMGDGKLGKCKECTKKDVHDRYVLTRKERSLYEAKRYKDPRRRAYVNEQLRLLRIRYPEKAKAWAAVARAVRSGKLIRGACVHCGATKRIQGHHDDYYKPLDVRWVCFKCHREREHGQVVSSQ